MSNRLAEQSSPYLRDHKDNPVDWYPWGAEALTRARERDKPILISIGYSACHWCHVMARESFEDRATAVYMNEHFVCVKVDREERPDIDTIYLEACQVLTGRGGWPLNVFITPAGLPFHAGTYFPREPRPGLPAWRTVLEAVVEAWRSRRFQIDLGTERVLARMEAGTRKSASEPEPAVETVERAQDRLQDAYDAEHGGFGSAPKFPQASVIEFLLATGEIRMSIHTLRAMACGGIYDQLGGGFCRYSVDRRWAVPHFEKMLYDSALLARAYLHAWQLTGDSLLHGVCCETLDWALREMRAPEGGFYSTLDADSEGVEGGFYLWSLPELRAALGDVADPFEYFGATEEGNFESLNVLVRADGGSASAGCFQNARRRLYEARAKRVRPARDEKCLTAWNALMISALAEASAALRRSDYLRAAIDCAEFIECHLRDGEGCLLRSYTNGRAGSRGYLEDHAFLLEAMLTLYGSTFEQRWFRVAQTLAQTIIDRFADDEYGGFFDTADDQERLIIRSKRLHDTPIPSGNASAAGGLLRLALLTGEQEYERHALGALRLVHEDAAERPQMFAHALQAIDFHLAAVKEIALVGEDTTELERVVRAAYRPHVVLAGGEPDGVPLLDGRIPAAGRATAYVCERFACRAPVTDPAELGELLA